jgi:hypothetical protein
MSHRWNLDRFGPGAEHHLMLELLLLAEPVATEENLCSKEDLKSYR